jgi:hypothetical protein
MLRSPCDSPAKQIRSLAKRGKVVVGIIFSGGCTGGRGGKKKKIASKGAGHWVTLLELELGRGAEGQEEHRAPA